MRAESMTSESRSPAPSGAKPESAWKSARGMIIGLLVFFALAAALGAYFIEPIEAAGGAAIDRFGLAGLAVAVLLVDTFPTPLSYVPFMFLALAGGVSVMDVLWISSLASYVGGLLGYGIGRGIGMPARLEAWMLSRYPRIRPLIDQYGGRGVAVIAFIPLPLAFGTWTAGALKIPPGQVALALLVRLPKTMLYLWMLQLGWLAGTG
jgi:membrane protein YqaA with SNARE-associated domain